MPRKTSPKESAPAAKAPSKKLTMPDPAYLVKEVSEQIWKQTEDFWGQMTRNPAFLAAISTATEQSHALTGRVQELVSQSMKSMNMVTRDDIQAVIRRLDALSEQLADLNDKLDELTPQPAPAPKPVAKPKATTPARRTKKASD